MTVQIFIIVQHWFCLLCLPNPVGSKQEADGKVLIIPAILSNNDYVIITLGHTQ